MKAGGVARHRSFRFEWALAWRYLWAARKGAGVSFIGIVALSGIALSVATLITVMSVMQGFRLNLLERLIGYDGHLSVRAGFEDLSGAKAMASRLSQSELVSFALPLIERPAYASAAGEAAVIVRGVYAADLVNYAFLREEALLDGSMEDFTGPVKAQTVPDGGAKSAVRVALGAGVAARLGVHVGESLLLLSPSGEPTPFGVAFSKKSYVAGAIFATGISEYDDVVVLMPFTEARYFFRAEQADSIDIRLYQGGINALQSARGAMEQILGAGYRLTDWRQRHIGYFQALQTERRVMRIILSLIVGLATMNIVTGLVILVRNKTSDIGVLRSMGATRGTILRIFFHVGTMIGLLGTALGVVCGLLFCHFIGDIERFLSALFGFRLFNPEVYLLSEIPAIISWHEVTFVMCFTAAMTMLSTFYPAWRAARLDPVGALQHER